VPDWGERKKIRMVCHPDFLCLEDGIAGCGGRSEPHQSGNANGAVRASPHPTGWFMAQLTRQDSKGFLR